MSHESTNIRQQLLIAVSKNKVKQIVRMTPVAEKNRDQECMSSSKIVISSHTILPEQPEQQFKPG